jgi:hypothetical protein
MKARINYRQMIDGKLHTQQLVVSVISKFNGGILVNMDTHDYYPRHKCIATENIIEFIN